ncbi:MAG: phage tail protein, partial [Pseudomonas paracarnis]
MIDPNSQFFAILTATGEAKQANADALGIPWKLTELGVGDANGTDPIPDRAQKKLINERRRRPLNQLSVDPANPNIIVAEQIIPADEGGWWIREIGLYDADGDLVAVANCAPSYKPLMSQGSGRTQVVRMNFIVSSAANVVLKIDPDVVLASRRFVTDSIAEAINKQDQKQSVLVATTGPIQLAGALTIDGVPVPAASRVLVKNQAQAKDNGLYLTGDIWTRTADADVSTEVTPGLLVHVEKGLTNGDSVWQLVTDAPITLGTTDLVFEMAIGRTGSAGTFRSVSVDKNGRVVGGTNPSTLAESGIEEPVNRLFPFRGVRVFAQA